MEDVGKVEELVEERADAKARRDYAAADAIRDQLNAMGISVDDRSREWRVADAPYARARGDSASVDVAAVEALVSERSQAKIAGEYDTADAIRDRLRNEFGVSVDDRVKEWVVDGRSAAAPAARACRGASSGRCRRWTSSMRVDRSAAASRGVPLGELVGCCRIAAPVRCYCLPCTSSACEKCVTRTQCLWAQSCVSIQRRGCTWL